MELPETFYFRKQIEAAYDIAVSKAREFPNSWPLFYDAACYACLVGKRADAEQYLKFAMAVGDEKAIKLRALEDPD